MVLYEDTIPSTHGGASLAHGFAGLPQLTAVAPARSMPFPSAAAKPYLDRSARDTRAARGVDWVPMTGPEDEPNPQNPASFLWVPV